MVRGVLTFGSIKTVTVQMDRYKQTSGFSGLGFGVKTLMFVGS